MHENHSYPPSIFAAVVHFLVPKTSKTFDYASMMFLPNNHGIQENVEWIDIIWNIYDSDSLKTGTTQKRGKWTRRRVSGSSRIQSSWNKLLLMQENKTEIFRFLGNAVMQSQLAATRIYVTDGENMLCSQKDVDCSLMSPCNHEEADTQIFLHAVDAAQKGCQKASNVITVAFSLKEL